MIEYIMKYVRRGINWLEGRMLGRFIVGLITNYNNHNITRLSAESTYYLILSVVPFFIFFVNLILFFAHSQLPLLLKGLELLPPQTQEQIIPLIMQLLSKRSETILSIGILAAFWSTAQGVQGLVRSINEILGTKGTENNMIMVYVKAVMFTFLWAINGIASLLIVVYGDALVKFLGREFLLPIEIMNMWQDFMCFVPVVVVLVSLSIFYRYAPKVDSENRLSWNKAILSSIFASVIWFLVTNLYRYYVANMGNLSLTYGSLVGLMVLFIWLNLSVRAVLIGVEITRVLEDMNVLSKRNID